MAGRKIIWAFGANFPAIRRATSTTAVFGFEAFKKGAVRGSALAGGSA
jgi:hypothetical protein